MTNQTCQRCMTLCDTIASVPKLTPLRLTECSLRAPTSVWHSPSPSSCMGNAAHPGWLAPAAFVPCSHQQHTSSCSQAQALVTDRSPIHTYRNGSRNAGQAAPRLHCLTCKLAARWSLGMPPTHPPTSPHVHRPPRNVGNASKSNASLPHVRAHVCGDGTGDETLNES